MFSSEGYFFAKKMKYFVFNILVIPVQPLKPVRAMDSSMFCLKYFLVSNTQKNADEFLVTRKGHRLRSSGLLSNQ